MLGSDDIAERFGMVYIINSMLYFFLSVVTLNIGLYYAAEANLIDESLKRLFMQINQECNRIKNYALDGKVYKLKIQGRDRIIV
mmetsp:Transcript_13198/g.20568  ORF Transcript_13198/g.20568 Transcript_13198/m.20568 type:complete len:84 (-) Transcript_13198:321-572(-)